MPALFALLLWVVLVVALGSIGIVLVRRFITDLTLQQIAHLVIIIVCVILLLYLLIPWMPPFPGKP